MHKPAGYNPSETHAEGGLPFERLRPVSWRSLWIEAAVAVGVVVLLNFAALTLLERHDPNRFRVQVQVKYDLLRNHGQGFDSLVLGDSTPNQGVMPKVLDQGLGGRWLNLATVANMLAANDAWMLAEYIDTYGPPKRVILCHVPDMWARQADVGVMAPAPIPATGFEKLDPPVEMTPKRYLQLAVTRYFPLYSKSESLSTLLTRPWQAADARNDFGSAGFYATFGQGHSLDQSIEMLIQEYQDYSFEVSEINQQAMQRLIELAETHGFTIYLMPGSVSERVAASLGYRKSFDAMIDQYRAWQASSDHVELILDEPQAFPDAMMQDAEHLNVSGAQAWTRTIIQAIIESESRADSEVQDEQ